MNFLREFTEGVEFLTEQTQEGKVLYLEGPMIMTEAQNRNGRIYQKSMMEAAVDKYQREYVAERRALGELNHPERPFADPKHAAIMVESLSWHGNNVVGKARVLNTPDGQIIKALMEVNFKMGVSTRGLGKVNEATRIVEKYLLNAIDAVDMPSGQICYVNAVNESTEWVETNGVWTKQIDHNKAGQLFMEKFEQLIKNMKKA